MSGGLKKETKEEYVVKHKSAVMYVGRPNNGDNDNDLGLSVDTSDGTLRSSFGQF